MYVSLIFIAPSSSPSAFPFLFDITSKLTSAPSAEEDRARRFKMHFDFFSSANADEQEAELGRLNEKCVACEHARRRLQK